MEPAGLLSSLSKSMACRTRNRTEEDFFLFRDVTTKELFRCGCQVTTGSNGPEMQRLPIRDDFRTVTVMVGIEKRLPS